VLLAGMARAIAWSRPDLTIECATGVELVRRALQERACDALVVAVEPRSRDGAAMLKIARTRHPSVTRVAYCVGAECDGTEVRAAHEIVALPADVHALLVALDRALRLARQPARTAPARAGSALVTVG